MLLVSRNTEYTQIFETVLHKTCLPCRVYYFLIQLCKNICITFHLGCEKTKKTILHFSGKTQLPFLKMLQCPCFGGYCTVTLLLLRHMTTNLLLSQADKCFLSITVNYVCQLSLSTHSSSLYILYWIVFFAWIFLSLFKIQNKTKTYHWKTQGKSLSYLNTTVSCFC